MEGQLEEVLIELRRPALASSGEGVVLDELIEQINSPHMTVVVPDDRRALDLYLLVVDSPVVVSSFAVSPPLVWTCGWW